MLLMDHPVEVTFYTRPGCHLCEDAAAELGKLAPQFGMRIKTVDITLDAQAHDRWWADIPVVALGAAVLRAPFDGRRLRRWLLDAMRAAP